MSDDNSENGSGQTTESKAKPASSWLGRVLWLGPRVAEARQTTFGPSQPGFAWYDVARQICDDVVKIGETGKGSWAVLLLDVTAVELLVRAYLARAGLLTAAAGPLGESDWDSARKIPAVEAAWGKLSTEQIATLMALLGPDRDATVARLSGEERDVFASGLHDLVMRLAEPLEIEANGLGRALFARWSRVIVVGVVLALAVGFAGKWIGKKLGGPNIALRAAVTISSQFPGQGVDHSMLVDGDPDTLGFHTLEGGQQWVVIDLGKTRKFNKIVVYNRPDGFEDRAVPLKVEVSNDNVNYTQVAERKETFDKWTAKGLHAEGRYVRLKNTTPNFFHLAEVELY
jgi:F5/8 type C domain